MTTTTDLFVDGLVSGLADDSDARVRQTLVGEKAFQLGQQLRVGLLEPQVVTTTTTPCDRGYHDWQRPMFYERDHIKPFCRRCGLETHS